MRNTDIVNNLLKKTNNDTGKAMNLVQDIVEKFEEYDKEGVEKFFTKVNEGVQETEGEDCLIVNDVLFDWRELKKPEVVDELVTLALNCMKTEENKNKLSTMLEK